MTTQLLESPEEGEASPPAPRFDARTIALVGLFVLGALYTLRIARSFLVPIAVSLLLDFLFSPVIRWFKRIGVPQAISA